MWVGLLHKHGKVQATPAIAAGIGSQNMRFKAIACLLMLSAAWVLTAPALSADMETISGFGGPGSVPGTLDIDREAKGVDAARVDYVEAYFDFKQQIKENYGLAFGFDYNAIYQAASKSLGDDAAAGGVLRMFGQWALTGRGTQNTGTLIYKVENRHRIGTDIAPQALGFEAGYVGLTAVPFSDIGWALTNLYWDQHLWGNRVALVGGVVDSTDYVDVYGLVNPWADFSNLAFSTDPTIPAPNQGLGAAVRFMATDNVYFLGGIADANGDPTDPGDTFDSFFNTAEFFTHIEFGWVASMEKAFSDNIHLTLWHMDAREQARTADGWGAAFSFSRLFAEKWEPFLRIGYAEDGGAMWEKSIGAGIGYHPNATSDALGAGLNWSRPSQDT
jgi:porin